MHTRLKNALVVCAAVLSFAVMCLWSYTSTIDSFRVEVWQDWDLSLDVQHGRMVWRRVYAFKELIPRDEYTRSPIPARRLVPNPRTILGFAYSSGHETAYTEPPGDRMLRLVDFWMLIIPLWFVLLIVSLPWLLWLRGWLRRRRERQVGFEVRLPRSA